MVLSLKTDAFKLSSGEAFYAHLEGPKLKPNPGEFIKSQWSNNASRNKQQLLCLLFHTHSSWENLPTRRKKTHKRSWKWKTHLNIASPIQQFKVTVTSVPSFPATSSLRFTAEIASADGHSFAVSVFQSSDCAPCPFLLTSPELHWCVARGFWQRFVGQSGYAWHAAVTSKLKNKQHTVIVAAPHLHLGLVCLVLMVRFVG